MTLQSEKETAISALKEIQSVLDRFEAETGKQLTLSSWVNSIRTEDGAYAETVSVVAIVKPSYSSTEDACNGCGQYKVELPKP